MRRQLDTDTAQPSGNIAEPDSDTITLDFRDVLYHCENWQVGDHAELKALGIVIQHLFNDDEEEAVDQLCTALLEHEDLPAFYKAKMHAYLSACEEHDTSDQLILAVAWIAEARKQSQPLGFVPQEIEQWQEMIANQKAEFDDEYMAKKCRALREHTELPIRPIASAYASSSRSPQRMGMKDGTDEVEPGVAIAVETVEATGSDKTEANKARQ
ncbi:hypothetical protein LTR36_010664 [Oleoguttula mirabilis]|uniref:Uncharacterized protein n=1 Tax=Oleoguttula mirabilis TaxID=1507867 RepID=A0AAV9JR88_9PEZI|nr:hypothetical protein LTR36_010664 [Oleoguttula mirabilis]